MNQNIFKYEIKDLLSKKIFGISLIIAGINCLFSKTSVAISFGITIIFVGLIFVLNRGFEIDKSKHKLREFISFFGLKYGLWSDYQQPQYISVFKMKVTNRRGNKTLSVINVNLFDSNDRSKTVYQTGSKEDAFTIATFLKETLDVKVLDATTNESKWV
jgi:hypothetical protein